MQGPAPGMAKSTVEIKQEPGVGASTTATRTAGTGAAASKPTAVSAAQLTPTADTKTVPTAGGMRAAPLTAGPKTVGPKLPPADGHLPPPMTPAEVAEEERNVEALVNSPYVNPGMHRTPAARTGVKALQPQEQSYEISPYRLVEW